jgi:Zn-dependent M28 family amino/carboxypeptidase
MEIVESKRRAPIPGANDGASGVAILLQLARMLRAKPPGIGVIIVLFDGEDYGDFERDEGVFLGARHFAANMRKVATPEYGILLDMVGDKDLRIFREAISERRARRINSLVFSIARELGHRRTFVDELGEAITDDHVAINDAGVPCIDLIDFDYGPWHTVDDTPDKCSAESLRIVGEVVAEVVYREKDRS